MKKYLIRILVALTCALMAASVSWAAISISNTQALGFGTFAAGSGGTVVVSAANARSKTGGVVLVSSVASTVAQFTVSRNLDANTTYAITLPLNDVVTLTRTGGGSMAVNTFTSNPTPTGTFGAGGTQTLSVGATLTVGSSQATGIYSGTFDVTVAYN